MLFLGDLAIGVLLYVFYWFESIGSLVYEYGIGVLLCYEVEFFKSDYRLFFFVFESEVVCIGILGSIVGIGIV